MRSVSSRLRKFQADVDAMAAIEFAIVLPFMLLLMIGGVELGNGMAISVKVTETTHTVADLVSQNKCLTSAQVNAFLQASARVIAPYSVNYAVVTVSEVTTTGSGGTATVTWSQSYNGTPRTQGQSVTLPSSLASAPANIGLILGEVTYAYAPNLGYTIAGTVTLSDSYYLYPRQSTFVPVKTTCP
jgi:Flp pilus assembly protein TadG